MTSKISIKVGACQPPEIIGNPSAAIAHIIKFAKEAEKQQVDLLLFPECFLSGYITTKPYIKKYSYDFQSKKFASILKQLQHIKPALVIGIAEKHSGKYYNSAVVINKGKINGVYRKTHLVPGEAIFTPGEDYPVFNIKGLKYGMNICYDTQFAQAAKSVALKGAKLLLSPAQNMMRKENAEKWKNKHQEICAKRVQETGLWLVRSDVTGIRPKDKEGIERIAYGPTLVMNPKSEIIAQVPLMTEGMITVDIYK